MFRVSFQHHFHSLWRNERRANFNCFPNIYIDQFIILKKLQKHWIISVILAEKENTKTLES